MTKKLTAKKIEKYLKRGACCPRCGEDVSIEGEQLNVEGTEASQPMHCLECGLWWTDIYVLARIETNGDET